MLVLARLIGDRVVMDFSTCTDADLLALRDKPIDITLVDVRHGNQARLGFTAPQSVAVDRLEVWEDKQRAAAEAAKSDDAAKV